MRKILVLRGGALGDFIVTLPALGLLRERWPEARIELVGNAVAAELARARGLLDAVHSQHERRWSVLFSNSSVPPSLAACLGEFDLVLNYWPDPDGELRSHFPVRPGQKFLSAGAMPTRSPAAAHYCEPPRELGLAPAKFWFPLHPLAMTSGAHGSDVIAIHPGSGSQKKNWPIERWLELIRSLAQSILLVLGEAELEPWNRILRELPDDGRIQLAANLPLEELVTRFASARKFLGHDSGISHLAAACGTPCLLLFGPTDPAMWAPPAPHVSVLRRGADLASISVADVRSALSS